MMFSMTNDRRLPGFPVAYYLTDASVTVGQLVFAEPKVTCKRGWSLPGI